MFAARFDDSSSYDAESHSSERNEITVRTRGALDGLKYLVSSEVRIGDFKLPLTGVLAELKGTRKSAVEADLEKIATFFSTDGERASTGLYSNGAMGDVQTGPATGNMLASTLDNFHAAFQLERYREVLGPFKDSLMDPDLKILPSTVIQDIQSSHALEQLMDNFKVSAAPRLLHEVKESLGGLSYHALMLVGQLKSAGLFLAFLRSAGRSFESGALDRAQQRASSNAHASGVLMHLLGLQTLLEPFYNRTLQQLSDVKDHLEENLRVTVDGQECLSLLYLTNVCENWGEVEIYFRDGGDTFAGTEDIQRSVAVFQETGMFISALSSHPGGSALTLRYQQRGGKYVTLSPEELQAHVQWAVLGGDVAALEEFVSSFREAQRAHAIRIELEDEGHPDFQAVDVPSPLAATCRILDISEVLTALSSELSKWRFNTLHFCGENPRLLLLNRRNRVQLLLILRQLKTCDLKNVCASHKKLLGYIIQCFPPLHNMRRAILQALQESVVSPLYMELNDLALAGDLISRVESCLKKNPGSAAAVADDDDDDVDCAALGDVSRLELFGLDATGVYCQHLSYMVSQTYCTAQPGVVLWGERATTERAIQDLLLVASTPSLTSAVHVVGVDRLTPRVRERLLRGIESTVLRSPLLLIFSDRDGTESFSQFQLEDAPVSHNVANVKPHLWSSLPREGGGVVKQNNAELWVIAGKCGAGKSRWINQRTRTLGTACLRFAVHEGFTAKSVIDRYSALDTQGTKIALSFDIHAVECFDPSSFARFLHHLLCLGLLIDENSGSCYAILPCTSLEVFIELPEVCAEVEVAESLTCATSPNWPPTDDSTWHPSHHPFLVLLPAVVVAMQPDHYIAIREKDPYEVDHEAALVATYLALAKHSRSFETMNLPGGSDLQNLLPAAECSAALQAELFLKFNVGPSKRVQNFLVQTLYDRFLYLHKMRMHVRTLAQNRTEEDTLQVRMGGSSHKVLLLFIHEALAIASSAKDLPETSVYTIRPSEAKHFEALVATSDAGSEEFKLLKSYYMETKELVISDGSTSSELRSHVAPAFGIEDTAKLPTLLSDCGHFLTPESLIRIMHMHSRRMLRASVIYEGETGVGKSQNLKLYSRLINANSSTVLDPGDLKLHLIAVIRAISTAQDKHAASDDAKGGEEGEEGVTPPWIPLTFSISEVSVLPLNSMASKCIVTAMQTCEQHYRD